MNGNEKESNGVRSVFGHIHVYQDKEASTVKREVLVTLTVQRCS